MKTILCAAVLMLPGVFAWTWIDKATDPVIIQTHADSLRTLIYNSAGMCCDIDTIDFYTSTERE